MSFETDSGSSWGGSFWKDAAERVISTAAQAALGVLVASGLAALGTQTGLTIVATAAAASLLKAIVANGVVDDSVSPASLASES